MELRRYWLILWRHRRMVAIVTASAALVALAMTYVLSPKYEAKATVLVQPQNQGVLEDRIVQKEAMGFPINLNPVESFEAICEFLKDYIDKTIQGKVNRSRGTPNYKSLAGFLAEQDSLAQHKSKRRKPSSQ